jgi:hypothetical protein
VDVRVLAAMQRKDAARLEQIKLRAADKAERERDRAEKRTAKERERAMQSAEKAADQARQEAADKAQAAQRDAHMKQLARAAVLGGAIYKLGQAYLQLAKFAGHAVVGFFKAGLAARESYRDELLLLEGASKIRPIYGGLYAALSPVRDSGSFMQAAISDVAAKVPLAREEINSMAMSLQSARLRGQNLREALEGMAIVASTQGREQAELFKNMASGAAFAGGSVKRLADDARARLGGIVSRQMLSLSVQSRKLRENFASIFQNLPIEGLLRGLNSVVENLSIARATGDSLKRVFDAVFVPLDGMFKKIGPVAKAFFDGMIIAALMIGIKIVKLKNFFEDTFGGTTLAKIDWIKAAIYAGGSAVAFLAGALSATVVTFGLVAGGLAWIWSGAKRMGNALIGILDFAKGIWKAGDWNQIGKFIVDGIVSGLKSGAGALWETMKGLAKGLLRVFKQENEIKSPSKKFLRATAEIPNAQVIAIKAGAPRVQAAIRDASPQPEAVYAPSSGRLNPGLVTAAAGRASGASVTVAPGAVQVTVSGSGADGGLDPADIERAVQRGLDEFLSRLASQMGARA